MAYNKIAIILLVIISFTSCLKRDLVTITGLDRSNPSAVAKTTDTGTPNISSVDLKNNILKINGSNFDSVNSVKITGPDNSNHVFNISSNSPHEIIALAQSNISLVANAVFSVLVTNSFGEAIQTITLEIPQNGADVGQILRWDGNDWIPGDLSALTYSGNWNATSDSPDLSGGGAAGEYYIVTTGGNTDLEGGIGTDSWSIGDWAVWNGNMGRWEKISNASYTWNQINKTTSSIGDITDVDISGSSDGKILKFSSGKLIIADDDTSGGVGSVNTSHIIDGSITNDDISGTANISQSKITGLPAISTQVSTNQTDIINKTTKPGASCGGTNKLQWNGTIFTCVADLDTTIPDTDTNTNAQTICTGATFLDGNGSCVAMPVDTTIPDTNTNAGTICAAGEYLDGDTTCKVASSGSGDITDVVAGSGLSGGSSSGSATLNVRVDDSTIEIDTNLQVKDGGITNTKLASGISGSKITTGTIPNSVLTAAVSLLGSSIESAEIANGTIINEDINASAAIAQSKIANLTTDLTSKLNLSGGTMTGALNLPTNGLVVGTDQVVVSGGDVGIGRPNPLTNLHVYGATDSTNGQLRVESTGNDARISLYNSDGAASTGRGDINMSKTAGYEGMRFLINNSDKMIIDENGNVGVGTVAPTAKLEVVISSRITALANQDFTHHKAVSISDTTGWFNLLTINPSQVAGVWTTITVEVVLTGHNHGHSSGTRKETIYIFINSGAPTIQNVPIHSSNGPQIRTVVSGNNVTIQGNHTVANSNTFSGYADVKAYVSKGASVATFVVQ